MPKKPAWSV